MARKPWAFRHRQRKSGIADIENFHPHAQRIAHFRLSILKIYDKELKKRERTKGEILSEIISLYHSGLICPEIFPKPVSISRATIYNWLKFYKEFGLVGLIPKFKWGKKRGVVVIPIRPSSKLIKIVIPGPPKRYSKYEFLPQLKWKGPPLDCPVHLAIFYSIGIRRGTKMPRRMKMLGGQISPVGIPNLDSLNAFIVDCMQGIVFKHHSQIVEFYSLKKFEWSPKITIYIRPLQG